MTNRKRTAEEAELETQSKNETKAPQLGRQMQGDGHDGTAHSIGKKHVFKKYDQFAINTGFCFDVIIFFFTQSR